MTANVPMIDIGRARLGMIVAEMFRRKRKMTRMTRKRVSRRVNLTSLTEARMESARSRWTRRSTEAGIWLRETGRSALAGAEDSAAFVARRLFAARADTGLPPDQ